MRRLTDDDYARLLEFRTGLRRFLRWSEEQATAVGLSPAQHQLLLAIRGNRAPGGPTIGDVAGALLVRHHSAVGLVDRAVAAGLVRRRLDTADQRVVRLSLTALGSRRLRQVSERNVEALVRFGPSLGEIGELVATGQGSPSNAGKIYRDTM